MKLATWNVNSVRARAEHVARWLEAEQPDLLLLQEIKCEAAVFPAERFARLGYRAEVVGQKGYNGVAILSRGEAVVRHRALPGLAEGADQARYLEIAAGGLIVGNLYAPNGNSGGASGFAYKLAWLDALARHAAALLAEDMALVLAGDLNVCPTAEDLAPGALGAEDALVHPESRRAFRRLIWSGLTDAVRALHPGERIFTFWDYQAQAFERDLGLRIDHALLAPTLAEALHTARPDRTERAREQPSDHVPLVVELVL